MDERLASALESKLKEADEVLELKYDHPRTPAWFSSTEDLVARAAGKDSSLFRAFHNALGSYLLYWGRLPESNHQKHYQNKLLAKEILKQVIQNLRDFGPPDEKPPLPQDSTSSVSVTVINQNLNQLLQTATFANIVESIQQMTLPESQKEEAQKAVEDLQAELEEENPRWDSIKEILNRLLSFSKDLFFAILPFLIEKMSKIR